MIPLPEDIMLVVFERLDIDAFFNIRLSCHDHHDLIDSHVVGIASAVAHNAFPNQQRIFLECEKAGSSTADCRRWLRDLQLHHLAAVVVERYHHLTAEDQVGSPLRHHLTIGWRILCRLVQIHDDVRRMPRHDLPRVDGLDRTEADDCWLQSTGIEDLDVLYELTACRRRCDYLDSLTLEQVRAYRSLWDPLLMAVLGYSSRQSGPLYEPGILNQSTVWWVLGQLHRHGPLLFWNTWKLHNEHERRDKCAIKHFLEESWHERDNAGADHLSDSMILLWNEAAVDTYQRLKVNVMTTHSRHSEERRRILRDPNPSDARKQRKESTRLGGPSPATAMSDVPFEQKLNCDIMGEQPWEERPSGRRLRGCYGVSIRMAFASPCDPSAQPNTEEFKQLRSQVRKARYGAFGLQPPSEVDGMSFDSTAWANEDAAFESSVHEFDMGDFTPITGNHPLAETRASDRKVHQNTGTYASSNKTFNSRSCITTHAVKDTAGPRCTSSNNLTFLLR